VLKGLDILGKDKKISTIYKLQKIDNKLYYFILAAVLSISLIVRIKRFNFYYTFDLQNSLGNVYNIYTYYKLIGLVALLIISLTVFIYRNHKYRTKLKLDAVSIGIGLVIASAILSTLFTPLTKEAFWGFYTRNNGVLAYISLFGIFFIVSQLKLEEKHLRVLSHCVNIISILFVTIGIFEFFGHFLLEQSWYKTLYIPAEMRGSIELSVRGVEYTASSILSQPNYFGAYCSIIFPFITIQAIGAKNPLDRILFSLGSIMLFVGTYISVSMGPWLALLITFVLILITSNHLKSYIHLSILLLLYSLTTFIFARYQLSIFNETIGVIKSLLMLFNYKLLILVLPIILLMILYYKFKKINKYKFMSIIIIVCILMSMIGFIYILQNVVPNNMKILSNRGYAWHYTYQILKENFIIGYGPDTFYYNFPQDNPDKATYSYYHVFDKPHNMYLQAVVDNGMFGLVGFIMLLIASLLLLLKYIYISEDKTKIQFSKAIFFTIIAYMIQGITNDNHMVIQPILYLLIASGIAVSREQLLKP
jgi:O-antigen ligase